MTGFENHLTRRTIEDIFGHVEPTSCSVLNQNFFQTVFGQLLGFARCDFCTGFCNNFAAFRIDKVVSQFIRRGRRSPNKRCFPAFLSVLS
jgi:hypothetical protein